MADTKQKKVENKRTFEVEVDGVKKKLAVKKPDQKLQEDAALVYSRAFRAAVQPADGGKGAIIRAVLDNVLEEQGFWSEAKRARIKELGQKLDEAEKKLARGGFKLSEGREVAIGMRVTRNELQGLLSERNALDLNTAEAMAENAKFNFLVSACTLDGETGKPYFKSVEDYGARSNDPDAIAAATNFGQLQYGISDDVVGRYPENKWLRAYKFTNAEHALVNKEGHLVDVKGRPVNDKGYLINQDGHVIDEEGNLVKEDGSPEVETAPFLDEDGNPVEVPEEFRAKAETKAEPAAEATAKADAEETTQSAYLVPGGHTSTAAPELSASAV